MDSQHNQNNRGIKTRIILINICLILLIVILGLFAVRNFLATKNAVEQEQREPLNLVPLMSALDELKLEVTEQKYGELLEDGNSLGESDGEDNSEDKDASDADTESKDKDESKDENKDEEKDPDGGTDDSAQSGEINLTSIAPEELLDPKDVADNYADYFSSSTIEYGSYVFNRINGKSYQENPNIALSDLRYLRILHYDYNHQIRLGEMIVNASISDSVLSIFKTLYENEYEIESMRLIDDFWTGDGATSDDASIAANNTSAFCYRAISGGTSLSNHAYGKAIDVNPKQNPYYTIASDGSIHDTYEWDEPYLDRDSGLPHMILKGDICESCFSAHGFSWGGDWTNPVDYQHFEF